MTKKTVLLVDDEQLFLEPLADALDHEGYRVLKARSVSEAIETLQKNQVDLVTIDIMIDPGQGISQDIDSHSAGLFLCQEVRSHYPNINAVCISVVSEMKTIKQVESMGIKFLRKGETPLRTVINILKSRLSGIAYEKEFG